MLWFKVNNPYISEDYIVFQAQDKRKYNCKINLDSMRWLEIELNSGTYYLPIEQLNYECLKFIKNCEFDKFAKIICSVCKFEFMDLTDYINSNIDKVGKYGLRK